MGVKKVLLIAACSALTVPAVAAPPAHLSGRIASFECGDNCYLTIKPAAGPSVAGLCVAKACAPWNEATKIPRRLIGARVKVTLGIGHQYDDAGNDMGKLTSFTVVEVLKN